MTRIWLKRMTMATAILAALSVTTAAYAQYVWLDEKGVKQYSDVPPPVSVPKNRILKQPSASRTLSQAAPATNEATPEKNENTEGAASNKTKGPVTTAEKNIDFQKRKKEEAEKEKKISEQAKSTAEKAKNCERARNYQRALESGQRISQQDKNGERSILSDEQRANDMQETKRALDACK